MADKFMHIPNDNTQITHPVDYNQWLKRLDSKLNDQTNQKLNKVIKLLNKKNVIMKLWGLMY